MKILLTGVSGQLGRELRPLLAERGELVAGPRLPDLSNPDDVDACLADHDPDLIVNAAAYTAVDRAEDEPELAMAVNASAPARFAAWAAREGRALVHFSTDYVFDGRKDGTYVETDPTAPLNVYGRSKREGERAVLGSGCRHLVLRSSWIYAAHGHNFLRTMLRLARDGRSLRVVGDQVGSPTWSANLARHTVAAIDAGMPDSPDRGENLRHCADRGEVSWCEFARMIFHEAVRLGLLDAMPSLESIDSSQFPQKATRPARSVLDCSVFENETGREMMLLASAVTACLEELKAHE